MHSIYAKEILQFKLRIIFDRGVILLKSSESSSEIGTVEIKKQKSRKSSQYGRQYFNVPLEKLSISSSSFKRILAKTTQILLEFKHTSP